MNGSLIPNDWLNLTARRNKRRRNTSFAGNAPSAIAKAIVLI